MNILYPSSPFEGLEILSCSDGHPFSKHLHDGYVLWLNSESGEHFSVKGCSDVLEPGSISVIEPGVVHSNHPCDPGHRHLRSFYFSEGFLESLRQKIFERATRSRSLPTAVHTSPGLWKDLAVLHEHMLHSTDRFSLEETIVSVFAGVFLGYRHAPGQSAESGDWRIPMLKDYLHAHWAEPVSLTTLAQLARCTEYHVIRLFRRHAGLSPHAFLTQVRLEKSRQLMDRGMPIANAALASGFCDQSHLTRVFKNRYGITPGQYLKQRRLC